jgi:hypothetical protein
MTQTFDIANFIKNYNVGLSFAYAKYVKKSFLSKEDFLSLLYEHIEQYVQTSNLFTLTQEEQFQQIFYISNQFAKSFLLKNKKNINYICPGCAFENKQSLLDGDEYLTCKVCKNLLITCADTKLYNLYKTFSHHNKVGFRCKDCNRFIPKNNNCKIICPYLDCCFVGNSSDLKKMRHPSTAEDVKSNFTLISSNNSKVEILNKIIDEQSNLLSYKDINFTVPHKLSVYQAFKQILNAYPDQMIDYIFNNSRSGGFQHKLFQCYISILEKSFPLVIKKNKKNIIINNLLDNNLCLFDGVSTFETYINKNIIKNNTQEYYIGGRKASYTKPYYIGKLLNVLTVENNQPILHLVDSYSFNQIKLKSNLDKCKVMVTHLRVPPHYQMGGMVYINRIRKTIVDEVKKYG